MPEYDFTRHQRTETPRRVPPADVIIIEGILVLHMEGVRDLLNMKIFVDTDDDVRLARRWKGWGICRLGTASRGAAGCGCGASLRGASPPQSEHTGEKDPPLCNACRIQRDVSCRGRDVAGVLHQYTRFVKPAFQQFVAPSRKHADIIVPWSG